ncbi:MAG TPA: response regulator transcription factor, partial [Myxococcales bacterium]|nr:response regulator transcription factor [Myxococcales bacterium]
MTAAPLVLVVEDEKDLADLMQFNLQKAGYETLSARSGDEALAISRTRTPDLVLLDLMLPGIPGTEVCRQLKSSQRTRNVPVIMVTARGEEVDRVVGFELGADDFVTKPFSMRELILRVRAVLRRGEHGETDVLQERVGPIRIDPAAHRAYVADEEMQLTALEFTLLSTFMSRVGRL